MAPPAKRRRRSTVEASEDEDEQPPKANNTLANFLLSSPSSPPKLRAPTVPPSPVKRRATNGQSSKNDSPLRTTRRSQPLKDGTSSSPKKARDAGKGERKGKSADLKTLFSKQAQRATRAGSSNDNRTVLIVDAISDPISEDDEVPVLSANSSSLVGQHARKRLKVTDTEPGFTGTWSASQRFLRPPRPVVAEASNDDSRPWSERFGPRNLDELAVHKKKVADVRRWLEAVMRGQVRQRLLILKGAAGSGKTTTVRLLANDMGCELLEWKNPVGNAGTGFVSASMQFEEFLGRGGKFGALDVESAIPWSTPGSSDGVANSNSKKIIVIEEFPNTFSRSSSVLTSFRRSILQYLAIQTSSPVHMLGQQKRTEAITPVIMVISETLLTTTSASADSLTAHRLLGPDVLRHPSVGMIEFNAVAPSLLTKALEVVVQKESRKSGRRRTPGPLVLKRLGETGDIRNAISLLEFLCLKGDLNSDWGAKVTFAKQKKGARGAIALTRGEKESLELVSQREASLGIFHSVGKVVYNKRDETPSGDPAENLPSFLTQFSRPKKSQVSVDALIDETGTDTHTFISALHENYVLSCEGTDPMDLSTPMDYVNECIEYLSQSDLLCPSRDIFFGGRGGGDRSWDSGSHLLRQDEMTFQVAVRGMLFSLPNPVKRKTWTMQKGSDAFKMFYPASLKLWRAKEEIEGQVDVWSSKLLKGEDRLPPKNLTDGASVFRRNQASADTFSTQRKISGNASASESVGASHQEAQGCSALPSLGNAARNELLLDRLPYMTHIARARKTTIRLCDLEKIVSFSGVLVGADDESDADDDIVSGETWATDKPSEETSPRKRRTGIKARAVTSMLAQKLVLSDDDIED